ncbi:MAG: sigma-70 family RNA polymerase sigma factor [Anaerolineae bacterium]|nr:sigma-70 family RNA polymerase sigma factor [Anaerolineae bacterium]
MVDTPTIDETVLLPRLKAGDQAAYAQAVEAYSAQLYHVALRMLGSEAEAEDVLQETFLDAFKNIDRFEGRSQLSTWLHRIAANNALMRLRKKRPTFLSVDGLTGEHDDGNGSQVPKQLYDWCCLPESELLTEEARAEMRAAVEDLSDALRVVFVLRDIEGLSTQETADVLDISASAVKSRLMRARLALRERLTAYFQGAGPEETR